MLQYITALDHKRGIFTVEKELNKFKNKNQNLITLLFDKFVNQHCHYIEIDDIVDSEGEFCQINHGLVCVTSDVDHWIIEEESDFRDHLLPNDKVSALLSATALDDGSGGKFADDGVLLLKAIHELKQNLRIIQIECEVDFVALVEVLVDLLQYLRPQYVVISAHLASHFLCRNQVIRVSFEQLQIYQSISEKF